MSDEVIPDAVEAAEEQLPAQPIPMPDAERIRWIIEASLLAAGQPLTPAQLSELFPEEARPSREAIGRALLELQEACEQRGVELIEVASGFRFQVKTELKPWITRMWTERPPRYSRALLETLSLVAYRQPITRGEIESIRGVAVSSNIIRTLEEREWVRVVGHRDVPGKPALYGTTKAFLDYFNLKSLDQLPPLSELREIPDLEPQLDFDGDLGKSQAGDGDTDDSSPHPDSNPDNPNVEPSSSDADGSSTDFVEQDQDQPNAAGTEQHHD